MHYLSWCETACGINWLNRWIYRVFIVNTCGSLGSTLASCGRMQSPARFGPSNHLSSLTPPSQIRFLVAPASLFSSLNPQKSYLNADPARRVSSVQKGHHPPSLPNEALPLHSRRSKCIFERLDSQVYTSQADGLPVNYETGTKRRKGSGRVELAWMNGFYEVHQQSLCF